MTVRIRTLHGLEVFPDREFESFTEAFDDLTEDGQLTRDIIIDDMSEWVTAEHTIDWIMDSILSDGGDSVVVGYLSAVELDLDVNGRYTTDDGVIVITKEGDSDE